MYKADIAKQVQQNIFSKRREIDLIKRYADIDREPEILNYLIDRYPEMLEDEQAVGPTEESEQKRRQREDACKNRLEMIRKLKNRKNNAM